MDSVRDEFDQGADIVGRRRLSEVGVITGDVGQDERDDVIVSLTAGEVTAFASDLPEHQDCSFVTPHI
jgi:hypothetical protein